MHYPPSTGFGGVTESSYQLSQALARLNVDVSVLTSDATLNGRISPDDFKAFENAHLKIHSIRHCLSRKSAMSFSGHTVIKKIVAGSDVVYLNGIYAWPVTVAAWYARRFKKPYIVALRNGLDPFMFRIRRWKKMAGFRLYVRPILANATAIHATATQEVEHAKSFGIDGNFAIIPNGIDTINPALLPNTKAAEDFWPQLAGKRVVLFLSRLSPQKGLDMLLPAWEKIVAQHRNAILVIAGPDYQGFEKVVRGLVAKHHLHDSVLLTGQVVDERKWALYRRAELFVLPSYAENFGNVVAEALAFGLPVLTTTATPWDMLPQFNCGLCVSPTEGDVLAGLSGLISLPQPQLRQMGANSAKLLASLNTWHQSAQAFVDLYRTIQHVQK